MPQTPNKAPEPTTTAVTTRAPSSTARASRGRGSSLTLGKITHMHATICFLFAASVAQCAVKSFDAQGLRASSFTDDGRLQRKIAAESASGPFATPIVEKAKVEFFGKDSATTAVAVIEAQRAQYLRAEEVIAGESTIQLSTEDGAVSGKGFRCALDMGYLELRSEVRFVSSSVKMSGDQATVQFDAKLKQKDVIREVLVTGHIVVERAPTAEAPFDRAECSFARFEAARNKVYLKAPISAWRNGEKTVIDVRSGFVEFDLREKPNKAPEPTTTAVTPPAAQESRQP
jgi:hypothetical protein